jgi:hypothetical protein
MQAINFSESGPNGYKGGMRLGELRMELIRRDGGEALVQLTAVRTLYQEK